MCRLQQLDQHCQSSAQQVMELLSRQNQLVHERQLLTEEMHNLRVQVRPPLSAVSKPVLEFRSEPIYFSPTF